MLMSLSPTSALVEGVNSGGSKRADSLRPSGSVMSCIVPDFWYSAHAEPAEGADAGVSQGQRLRSGLTDR